MNEMTVKEFIEKIKDLPPNAKLLFGGGLTFSRIKRCAEDEFVIEFANVEAELSPQFQKRHPNILVAFRDAESLGENEPVGISTIPRL